ncbi:MAG: DUF47 domain-containing protein [Chloroflexi bacterium]|nr:DUF47 domain-containing protein [Chloroflexota bacterium]
MVRLSLFPQEQKFYEFFEQGAANLVTASDLLAELVNNWENVEDKVQQIIECEHEGDSITHQIMDQLHRTFVTPIDREDITALAHSLDDVMDFIEGAARTMSIYKVSSPTLAAQELAAIIVNAAKEVHKALSCLHQRRQLKKILSNCIELNRLENEADEVLRTGLGRLFDDSANIVDIIKWREIYEQMESATDRCEDIANVLEGIILKNA